jgi:phosphoglycolate phosphatase
LSSLLNAGEVVIQCHDNPDADTIASAFAIHTFLAVNKKKSRIVYSGRFPITNLNLLDMIQLLEIPIEFVRDASDTETLVIADGQYGAENAKLFYADFVVVLDHHKDEGKSSHAGIINSQLGSCSTLVWDLLRKERFPFGEFPNVSTALYYGLFTDTGGLSEIYHPLDKDMRDFLVFDRKKFFRLQNTSTAMKELSVAGVTPAKFQVAQTNRYSIYKTDSCDPVMLSNISDLSAHADGVDLCVVYSKIPGGIKLSARSHAKEIMACDFAEFMAEGVGTFGGQPDKSIAHIKDSALRARGITSDDYLISRAQEYFESYDIINAASHDLDVLSMPQFRKKKIPVGYVPSTEIFHHGAPMLLRTLEGDSEATASDEIYIMVGIIGEVYPIKAEKFHAYYAESESPLNSNYNYPPTVRNRKTGEVKELSGLIKPVVAKGVVTVHAKPADRNTKVFTTWNNESYMVGKIGDYIAIRSEDFNDVVIIREDIFHMTYEAV